MKIIDRVKAYFRQNRDDKSVAVSPTHEKPEPESAVEPVTEPAAEPAAEPATESVTEPAAEPATEPAAEPVIESVTEPTAETVTEPAMALAACPRCGATGEAPCTTPSGKATKTHKGREQ